MGENFKQREQHWIISVNINSLGHLIENKDTYLHYRVFFKELVLTGP